ncbi:probable bicarbonate transporter, ICT family protein [Candidatus Vecturithrix granuli]|uniref:Probable bicarbonate transporter, ICT family protein n=1 Tax=Vecturithrix granuli TaxID=1499967 RepID=A0A081BYX7_VECG1|nr:probable bicarbonate transporter, ICT family protein [Candidatus Vecturithrix granuli]
MNLEHSPTSHLNSVLFSFFLFFPLVVTPLINFIPPYLLLAKLLFALCFVIGFSQHGRRWWFGCFVLLGFSFCSVLWSVNVSLSTYQAIQLSYYAMGFLLFRTIHLHPQTLRWGIRLVVMVSLLIALDGLHQYFFRYDEYARYLQEYDPFWSQEIEQVAHTWIASLSGRVFTQFFALPSQLAGYLLMIFPLNAVLIFYEKRRWLKLFWSITFILNAVIFFFTKSFGAWLVLLCILVVAAFLWLWNKRILTWDWFLKIGSGFLIAAVGILYLIGRFRGQYLWNLQGNNPLWHRFLNWKTAFAIWREHLLLGSGLSTFGAMYPQYMQPGANEAQYAHNTYLQFAAELGIIGLVLVLWLVGCWGVDVFKGLKQNFKMRDQEKNSCFLYGVGSSLAGLGFLLHNIIDFDFYVFPLGLFGLAMLGLTLNIFSENVARNSFSHQQKPFYYQNRWAYFCFVGLVGISTLVLFIKDWQYVQAHQHKEQAIALVQTQQYQEASRTMQRALQFSLILPEYQAIDGSIWLYLRQSEKAIERYRTAIETDAVTPWFHAGLAEAHLQQNNLSMAYLESRRAAELFPLKSQYRQRMQQIQNQLPQ